MQPDGLSPYSQQPASCPYPETDGPSPCHPFNFSKIHLNINISSDLISSGFSTKTLYTHTLSPILATCTTHLNFLDLITQIVFGEEYRA